MAASLPKPLLMEQHMSLVARVRVLVVGAHVGTLFATCVGVTTASVVRDRPMLELASAASLRASVQLAPSRL